MAPAQSAPLMRLVRPNQPGVCLGQFAEFFWRCTFLYRVDEAVGYRLDCFHGFFSHGQTLRSECQLRPDGIGLEVLFATSPIRARSAGSADMKHPDTGRDHQSTKYPAPGPALRHPSSAREIKERLWADR